jgi:hypothetical protein
MAWWLEVIREVDKNEISRSEIAQAYRIHLSTPLIYLYHLGYFKLQAFKGVMYKNTWEFMEQIWQYKKKLFDWFCHAQNNSIAVDVWIVKMMANKMALMMGVGIKYSCGLLQWFNGRWDVIWLSVSRKGTSRHWFGREVLRTHETNHCCMACMMPLVWIKGIFL